jgi:radical SAM protein with 4Fe4S-binding SPASM domain
MNAPAGGPLRHVADSWRRSAHLGAALLGTTLSRPSAPVKVNLCLTYWCQYRCKTCNIWQRKPVDELTTDEVLAFIRENPHVTWADLTGGEIFLRQDIETILDAVVSGWSRLALLHFPTNGFLTDRIVAAVARIAGRGPRTIVTVSLDGDEALNDAIRGVKGGFRRQIETFRALRRIRGVTTVFGMTLSSYNVGRVDETFEACARECPGLTIDDLHLNVAQVSGHYYDNAGLEDVRPDPDQVRRQLQAYRDRKGLPRSAQQLVEHVYLRYLDRFLTTGRTPMPCHALRASCFIDPWGVVYPCITYARPLGRLRDTGMRLEPLWSAAATVAVQREIWHGECPQCWTACEAYQSILGNVLAGRLGAPAGEPPVRAGRAVREHVP